MVEITTKSTTDLIREILAKELDLSIDDVKGELQQEYGRSVDSSLIYRVRKELQDNLNRKSFESKAEDKAEPNILEREKISKVELIHRYLAMNEKQRPCEIRKRILKDHGFDIGTGGDVYTTCKNYLRKQGKPVPIYGSNQHTKTKSKIVSVESNKIASVVLDVETLQDFFEVVQSVGGKDVARKLLDIVN